MTILKEIEGLEIQVKQDTISSRQFRLAICNIIKRISSGDELVIAISKPIKFKKINWFNKLFDKFFSQ